MENKGRICIIMANMIEDFRDSYVVGIEKQANRLGYSTFVFSMPLLDELHTNKEEAIFDLIDFDHYEGAIFFEDSFSAYKGLGNHIEKMLHAKCHIPIVVLGESLLFSESQSENNCAGCEAVTDHIIETHGSELLYFLGGQPGQSSKNDIGFINSLKKHGLPCTDDNLIYGGYWMECGEHLAKDIAYHIVDKPDAVICQDDTVAFFFIKALAQYGIRVPEDIIVAGFGARKDSQNNILSITTISCNAEYTGRCAMARLHSLITGAPEPLITPPKHPVITGMSCGCGDKKPEDVRLCLEMHEKKRMQKIYYQNSQLEEKLLCCSDYKDLFPVILHSSYLIADKTFLAISTKMDDATSRCIYLRNHMWDDTPILFNSTELFPAHLVKNAEIKNMHILPLTYHDTFLGHIAVGYKEPLVYDNILKQYANRLSMALWQMHRNNSRNNQTGLDSAAPAITNKEAVPIFKENTTTNTILIQKDNTLHKIPLDNILFFESEGRKTVAVLKNGRYEVKKNLSQLEELLQQQNFMRVSKSALVNMAKVISITPDSDRTLLATLAGKITVRVSRKNANAFKANLHSI